MQTQTLMPLNRLQAFQNDMQPYGKITHTVSFGFRADLGSVLLHLDMEVKDEYFEHFQLLAAKYNFNDPEKMHMHPRWNELFCK